ncbi:HNH endonuclease [Nocardia uniformis]|uniref:HNH endonuclease n=1 Tax=Nocardia uniformis TaxID=53432 RepID=A0A849C7W4_9NOCA|nr:HNH endonuclease signature motif containing protein [Nocardia uniformis]NNH72470.1 HNH endonuclease [Nocardia uniformis]
MTVEARDRKILWARSHNACAICRQPLVLNATETDRESVVGDEAHIVAQSGGGPRAGLIPVSELDKYDNLILLCKVHHKQVDDQPMFFTAERLRRLKADHEQWAAQKFEAPATEDIRQSNNRTAGVGVKVSGRDAAAIDWDPQQSARGNPTGGYVTFEGHQGIYWVLVGILLLMAALAATGVIVGDAAWRIACVVFIAIDVALIIGFWGLAMQPVRLEVGVAGVQTFFPKNSAWMPWDLIDRIDVTRIDGNLGLAAWSRHADAYPTAGEEGMGAHYVPSLGAVTLCPLGPLRAGRREVVRALQFYGQNRCA